MTLTVLCLLYDPMSKLINTHSSLNDMRVKLSKDKDLACIPPCEDSFKQHVLRAIYQAKIWQNAHIPYPDLGNPEEYGWEQRDGYLQPIIFTDQSAPEILDDLCCNRKGKCRRGCTCQESGMKCIELCKCTGSDELCLNQFTHHTDEGEDE